MDQTNTKLRHKNVLRKGAAALVVIDMQEPFIRSVFEHEAFVKSVTKLVEGCKVLEVPIIGTTQYVSRMGDIIPDIRRALPRTPSHDKVVFDCCGSESFLAEVAATGATQILLCGLEAHICVSQTALGLIARGYQVHVAVDAIQSRTIENVNYGLEKMKQSGVLTSSCEMALYELMYSANSPHFKDILTIVK